MHYQEVTAQRLTGTAEEMEWKCLHPDGGDFGVCSCPGLWDCGLKICCVFHYMHVLLQ